jgi:hypothetical protein
MTTIAKLDVDALRRAHEEHDPELLASLYADGAESITVDVNNPPSRPRTVGRNRCLLGRHHAPRHDPQG